MKVIINKKEEIIQDGMTIQALLDVKNKKRPAVWVNGKQLLSAEYTTYVIQEADEIKILRVVAGG